mgnify:CR=1 FL=1
MAKQNRNTLKGYFETGDIPTGANYVDLIDSPVMLDTENTGSLNLQGTGSFSEISISSTGSFGYVSASGTGSFENILIGYGGAIQAKDSSGNINDFIVGNLADVGLFFGDDDIPTTLRSTLFTLDAGSAINIDSSTGVINFQKGSVTKVRIATDVGHISASGNISASGTISAFGSSSLVGLPTTEPSITGALWLSGSGGGSASGSKYLMVFTG